MKRHAYRRTYGTVDWDALTERVLAFNGDMGRALRSRIRNIRCKDCGLWKRVRWHR